MPTTTYLWDDDNLLAEFQAGSLSTKYTYEPQQYGNLISDQTGANYSQYHYDAIGSTVDVTNDQQQPWDSTRYSAFGQQAAIMPKHFSFCGRVGYYHDVELDSFYVRRRHYHPAIGRWLTCDPVEIDLNCYRYCLNSPLTLIDPTGLFPASPPRDVPWHSPYQPFWFHNFPHFVPIEPHGADPRPPGLKYDVLETEGCNAAELLEVKNALVEACNFLDNPKSKLCLPKGLKTCLDTVCQGTVLTKCIKQCDPTKGHHAACATAQVTIDRKSLTPPKVIERCVSSVPDGTVPAIIVCLDVKTAAGMGFSNPPKCVGGPANAMQVMFHELIHYCGSKHELDRRGKPLVERDLVFGCMKSCFGIGAGDPHDCKCPDC